MAMGNNPIRKIDPDGGTANDYVQDNKTSKVIWVDSTGEQAKQDAAKQFGHNDVKILSTNFFVNSNSFINDGISGLLASDQIRGIQNNYLNDVSSRLNVTSNDLVKALNGDKFIEKTNKNGLLKGLFNIGFNFAEGEAQSFLIEKALPTLGKSINFGLSFLGTTQTGLGSDKTFHAKRQQNAISKKNIRSLVNDNMKLLMIRIHKF